MSCLAGSDMDKVSAARDPGMPVPPFRHGRRNVAPHAAAFFGALAFLAFLISMYCLVNAI